MRRILAIRQALRDAQKSSQPSATPAASRHEGTRTGAPLDVVPQDQLKKCLTDPHLYHELSLACNTRASPRRDRGSRAREKQDKEEEQERQALAKSSRDQ